MSDRLVEVPGFLQQTFNSGVSPTACSFCTEIACETDAMLCGECSGQSCTGQCNICEADCQSSCQSNCQSACQKSCQDSETGEGGFSGVTLTLTGGAGRLTWRISGLSQTFNTGNGYIRAGITWSQFTVGGVSSISNIADYVTAPNTGGSTSVSHTISYEPGTYQFWGFVETAQGGYWPAGSGTVTVTAAFTSFQWTYAGLNASGTPVSGNKKVSGYGIYVTAAEWNELVDLVNDATGSSIAHVSSGIAISATVVNRVANALGIPTVSSGDELSASFFNQLRAAYNALG